MFLWREPWFQSVSFPAGKCAASDVCLETPQRRTFGMSHSSPPNVATSACTSGVKIATSDAWNRPSRGRHGPLWVLFVDGESAVLLPGRVYVLGYGSGKDMKSFAKPVVSSPLPCLFQGGYFVTFDLHTEKTGVVPLVLIAVGSQKGRMGSSLGQRPDKS